MPVTVTKTSQAPKLENRLKQLAKADVLVGIPAAKASRRGGEINNAEALFLFSKGSPLNGTPARPVLEPAITDSENQPLIATQMQAATQKALDGDAEGLSQAMNLAGQQAANAARDWFTNPRNGWAPNSPATARRKGSDRPGIDTGQMRRAITWVVEEQ